MHQDRRTFIKITSLASATLVPIVGTLAQVLGKKEEEISTLLGGSFNKDFEFNVIDNNLLNLHFYFINVKKIGSSLVPASPDTSLKSFMIVRLPQMHISEQGYWDKNWSKPNERLPSATLSGYSYLAFHLWPKDKDSDGKSIPKKLKFTLENILNWNNERILELITLVEWFNLKNNDILAFADYKKCAAFNEQKIWHLTTEEVNAEFNESYYEKNVNEPVNSFNYKKYKSLVRHFLDKNLSSSAGDNNSFFPITFLEFPQGVVLVPISRDEGGMLAKTRKQFWKNNYVNQKEIVFGYRKYEVWNNTLFYRSRVKAKGEGNEPTFKIETPSFRIAGLITDNDIVCPDLTIKECETENTDSRTLPSLLDKVELSFLTQFAKGEGTDYGKIDFKDKRFDIKESNGLFFTGLGIITHLKYYNEDVPKGIDLIEYEHIITEGRDVFIKVARIGIHNKNGKRYKHVIEGKRKITDEKKDSSGKNVLSGATSFIELKQYCECIEKVKNYEFSENPTKEEWDASNFINTLVVAPSNLIFNPAKSNKTHYRRYPWKEFRTIENKIIPIEPYQDGGTINNPACAIWFWPIHEGTSKKPKYLHSVFDADDWDNGTLNLATPFIFIRKSLIESGNSAEIKNLTTSYFKHISDDPNDPINLRRRITINNQKIAFTKPLLTKDTSSLSDQELSKALNESKSKTHILETDYIETYFDFSKPTVFTSNKPFAKVRFPLFPQVLRAKVFTDHIRDLTLQKIPSIVEYHENYLKHEFKEVDETTKGYANAAKQILANTDAFSGRIIKNGKEQYIDPWEEKANQTYVSIKNALQEAKNKLGNLAVPDIIPDTISLEKFGVTLPKDINRSITEGRTVISKVENTLNKISSFNPRELLRGKLSDVCGLDLTTILDELIPADSANNQTPLFEINKTLNKIEGEILNSPIYKAIVNFKINDPINGDSLPPDKLIQRYIDKINELRNTLETARLELNKKIKELSNEIPNAEELDNLVKNLFEQYRIKAFHLIKEERLFDDINSILTTVQANGKTLVQEAKEFVELEIKVIEEELTEKNRDAVNIIKNVSDELSIPKLNSELNKPQFLALKNIINEIIKDNTIHIFISIIKQYNDYLQKTNDFKTFFNDRFNRTLSTINEVAFPIVLAQNVYVNIETYEIEVKNPLKASLQKQLKLLNDVNKSGIIQLEHKVQDFKTLVIKNINGNSFQKKVVEELQTKYIKPYQVALNNNQKKLQDFSDHTLGDIIEKINTWNGKFETVYENAVAGGLTPKSRDSVEKIKALILSLNLYIDNLRKLDPYFYYSEQKRLQKDIEDIEGRFKRLVFKEFTKVITQVNSAVDKYKDTQVGFSQALEKFKQDPIANLKEYIEAKEKLAANRTSQIDLINNLSNEIIKSLQDTDEYKKANKVRFEIEKQTTTIKETKDKLEQYLRQQKSILQQQASKYAKDLDKKVKDYIDERESELINAVGADNILAIQANIDEAKNIYRLLTSIKQQDLTYNWTIDKFRDINFGIVSFKKFSNPNTTLKVDVKATTHFTSGKFPPAIEKIVTYSENRFTNFGISFFNSLAVNFNEISFIAGSDHSTQFEVKIKDVKFDGALSFVQAFESWLQTMGKGLILQLHGDHVALGYSLPIPAIKTPGFNIFNLSLNLDLRVYFDKRPLRLGFFLARPDSKFGIAVGIYAGFGFFGIVADTKKGIVEIDCALEAGAWTGISIGPISGEVKLAFGFRYTKNQFGVIIEGYIVAEGRLTVWILEVSARIYLGVVSQNSYVEGVCTVTYSVKLGFIRRSFSGSFHKKIAGAKSNNSRGQANKILDFDYKVFSHLDLLYGLNYSNQLKSEAIHQNMTEVLDSYNNDENELETNPVSFDSWKQFISIF